MSHSFTFFLRQLACFVYQLYRFQRLAIDRLNALKNKFYNFTIWGGFTKIGGMKKQFFGEISFLIWAHDLWPCGLNQKIQLICSTGTLKFSFDGRRWRVLIYLWIPSIWVSCCSQRCFSLVLRRLLVLSFSPAVLKFSPFLLLPVHLDSQHVGKCNGSILKLLPFARSLLYFEKKIA